MHLSLRVERSETKQSQDFEIASLSLAMTQIMQAHPLTYVEIGRFFPSSQLCSETLLPIPVLQNGYDSLGVRFVNCPHRQKQHDRDINAAVNIRNEGLRILALGTSASALGGDVRPKSSGRKKSMTTEAIPRELGSLYCTIRSV